MIASPGSWETGLKPSLQISQMQNEEQGKSIPEAAVKANLREIKLPKVISSLVKSLDDRDSPVLSRLMTRMGTPTSSEI